MDERIAEIARDGGGVYAIDPAPDERRSDVASDGKGHDLSRRRHDDLITVRKAELARLELAEHAAQSSALLE